MMIFTRADEFLAARDSRQRCRKLASHPRMLYVSLL